MAARILGIINFVISVAGLVIVGGNLIALAAQVVFGQPAPRQSLPIGIGSAAVLALIVGLLHNIALWLRFGFLIRFGRRDLYIGCSKRVVWLLYSLEAAGLIWAVSVLVLLKSQAFSRADTRFYESLSFTGVLITWFTACLGQSVWAVRRSRSPAISG